MKGWYPLLIVFLLQLLVPAWLIYQGEMTRRNGTVVTFRIEPRDPVDKFRGRYLRLSVDNQLQVLKEYSKGDTIFVTIDVDDEGFASFDSIQDDAPDSGLFIKTKVKRFGRFRYMVTFDTGFERYYLNEEVAPQADEILAQLGGEDAPEVTIEVAIREDGSVVPGSLFVDGIHLEEYLLKKKR